MTSQAFSGRPPLLDEAQMRSLLERTRNVRSIAEVDRALAGEFGISQKLVSQIRRGLVPKRYQRLWTEVVERKRA